MILLTFDFEEFDLPIEHGVDITLKKGIEVSSEGARKILDCLKDNNVKATIFCTTNFAKGAPDIMERIINEGHEVASHACDHTNPTNDDITESKKILEALYSVKVQGYRQPRMFEVDNSALEKAGYIYNSSLNPAFIPGRYMHLSQPRTYFMKDGVMQIPASVTPHIRFPLFWLSLHNLPLWLYFKLVRQTIKKDGYFITYMHPWEFASIKKHPEYKIPYIIKRNSGDALIKRLNALIRMLKEDGHQFARCREFVEKKRHEYTCN